jgi:hypothetical protein
MELDILKSGKVLKLRPVIGQELNTLPNNFF